MHKRAALEEHGQCVPAPTVDSLVAELARWRYSVRDEHSLHRGLARALDDLGLVHTLEALDGPENRYDLWLAGGIVIEVKVAGGFAEAMRQCDRYLARPDVTGLVLVTTKTWGSRGAPPREVRGKPFRMLQVQRIAF